MSSRASNRGLSGGGGHTSSKTSYKASPAPIPSSIGSSGSSAGNVEEPLSPRMKEAVAEAAESLSSLRNLVPPPRLQRGGSGTVDNSGVPPMPPSMSRCPSSRDAYEPAPSLLRAGSNSGPIVPPLFRSTSQSGIFTGRPLMPSDWRATVTVEERQEVRRKIRAAYTAQTPSFDDLIELVTSVEEEFLHLCSPSRLDYIKMSVQYDKRLSDKKRQLRGEVDSLLGGLSSPSPQPAPPSSSTTSTHHATGGAGKSEEEGKAGGLSAGVRRAEATGGKEDRGGGKKNRTG